MRYAIIADVHANLEAFRAVLADAEQHRCTHYAFAGDFVGYCADPKACLDIVRALNAPCVKGNHDEYCATDLPLDGFFVNPGAVGQPCDNNPKASYVIYDMRERTIELRRAAYDMTATQKKIREAGLGG